MFLEKCWFCLSSPSVEKHLVITIGDSFYMALAKGPINQYHVLILSVTHIQSAALLSQEDWSELDKFKTALKKFFASKSILDIHSSTIFHISIITSTNFLCYFVVVVFFIL